MAGQRRPRWLAMVLTLLIAIVGVAVVAVVANVVEASPFVGIVAAVVVLGLVLVYGVIARDEYRRSRSDGASIFRSLLRSLRRAVGFMISSS